MLPDRLPVAEDRAEAQDLCAANAGQPLVHLSEAERGCLLRYLSLLAGRLGENLVEVWLCGSGARGDMWPEWMPMHSDIDLLVLTQGPVAREAQVELIDATYPFFLECGRQISPQLRTVSQFRAPHDATTRAFVARVAAEGHVIYRAGTATADR